MKNWFVIVLAAALLSCTTEDPYGPKPWFEVELYKDKGQIVITFGGWAEIVGGTIDRSFECEWDDGTKPYPCVAESIFVGFPSLERAYNGWDLLTPEMVASGRVEFNFKKFPVSLGDDFFFLYFYNKDNEGREYDLPQWIGYFKVRQEKDGSWVFSDYRGPYRLTY